jgi:hypothetical protein
MGGWQARSATRIAAASTAWVGENDLDSVQIG